MAKMTTIERLQADVQKVLQDYADDTTKTMKELTKEVAKKGAKALRSASASAYGGGRYSKGWKVTMEEDRLGATAVIHNTTPGLPHLLEHGHATRNGGRVSGRTHIAPVEEELVEEFQKAVEAEV